LVALIITDRFETSENLPSLRFTTV